MCDPVSVLPDSLQQYSLDVSEDGMQITYTFDTQGQRKSLEMNF